MNKKEFIEKVATKGHTQKDVKEFLEDILETMAEVLETGEKVYLKDYFTLEVKDTAARKGRNPKTKEEILIPASKKVKFKCSTSLKNRIVNK